MKKDIVIGFSAGKLEKIQAIQKIGCNAIEFWVSDFTEKEYDYLTPEFLSNFKHVSVHAPPIAFDSNSEETKETITKIDRINQIRKLDLVVIHPDPIKDFGIFNSVAWPVAFENMDHQKKWGQKPDDIKSILDKNSDFNIVLDVNHIYANDKSMTLADEFYEKFSDRIKEFHLSGFATLHDPLFETKQVQIIKAIKLQGIPIIIESPVTTDTIESELNFVLGNL